MSLKTDYGLQASLNAAFDAGVAYVVTSNSALSTGLINAASDGKESFTITVVCLHKPATLRLQNKYWQAFRAGILSQLAVEDIYNYECNPTLNVADTATLYVDFIFSF